MQLMTTINIFSYEQEKSMKNITCELEVVVKKVIVDKNVQYFLQSYNPSGLKVLRNK